MAKATKKTTDIETPMKVIESATGIVTIPGVKTERVQTLIIGTAPLIVHKFSEKVREAILAKHKGEASSGKERKDPEANYNAARHRLVDGSDGFPCGGLKAAIVSGFSKDVGVFATKAKGGIRVLPDCEETNLVRIITDGEPCMREDVTRNETGVVDIRHRPEFRRWAMLLRLEFLPAVASMNQIMQAIALSGYTQGIGEWRPSSPKSKSGTFGTWRIAEAEEVSAFERGDLFGPRRPMLQAAE
jgi:hypothetical protein